MKANTIFLALLVISVIALTTCTSQEEAEAEEDIGQHDPVAKPSQKTKKILPLILLAAKIKLIAAKVGVAIAAGASAKV